MHDVLCVCVIDGLEETFHVVRCLLLREDLVHLLANLVEERLAIDKLHDEGNVHRVVVGFVVLDDIWVVQCVQNCDLIHYVVKIFPKFLLIQYFDRNLEILIVLVSRQKDFAKGARSQNFCLAVNVIVLLEFMNTLLSEALTCNKLLSFFIIILNWRLKTLRILS